MVQMSGGLSVGMSKGVSEFAALDQPWLLPLSLLLGTIGGGMVSWQVAFSRARPSMGRGWFWELLGKNYEFSRLPRFALMGLSLGLGFFVLTQYGVLPSDDLPQPLFDAMLAAPLVVKMGWALIFVVFFPVVEETLFRGFLFTGVAQTWGTQIAAILTTLVFVAVHMPKVLEYWPALVAVTFIGGITVVLRIRTGSLAPGIALHSTYNGALVAAAFLTQNAS